MADFEGLVAKYTSAASSLLRLARNGGRVIVITHIDADGLCSGSIVYSALMRRGANVTLRTVPDLGPETIEELAAQKYDFFVFTDLASTLVPELESSFGDRFMVIDHHQVPAEDSSKPGVFNAWAFGYDGGTEACSSAMAYLLASTIDPANRDLSLLSVVGALADRQDSGPGRSLTGLNRHAAEEAQAAGLLSISKDLMFTGRETRPIHESIALTSSPFLKGLTGSKDAVLAFLHNSGFALKDGASWRTMASLSPEEKMKLTELIAASLGSDEGATEALASLVGEAYTFEYEDSFTPLRDAREFGTLLNSCGRMGSSGVGISVCLGDRSDALSAAMKILSEYRSGINKALEGLTSEPGRLDLHESLLFIRGDGLIDEKLLGPVISILSSSPEYRDKVLVGRALSGETKLKISCRVGDSYPREVNLGLIMREVAEQVDGVGGGHAMAAGAKIPLEKSDQFSSLVAGMVSA